MWPAVAPTDRILEQTAPIFNLFVVSDILRDGDRSSPSGDSRPSVEGNTNSFFLSPDDAAGPVHAILVQNQIEPVGEAGLITDTK